MNLELGCKFLLPFTLMFMVRSQIASGVSVASASCACIIPALLNMMSFIVSEVLAKVVLRRFWWE